MKKDFFTEYRNSRKHHYIVPGILALTLSLSVVSSWHGDTIAMSGLSASVVRGLTWDAKVYDADLLIERRDRAIDIRIGKDAKKVDTLTLTLVGDPSVFGTLTTDDPTITITSSAPGMYVISARLDGSDLHAWDRVTGLSTSLPSEAAISATDASFMSEGVKYGLSVKGE